MIEKVKIPSGVSVNFSGATVTVSGANGKVSKTIPPISVKSEGGEIEIAGSKTNVNTTVALIESAFKGVAEGFHRKMQIIYAHFPMTIETKGNMLNIKNFLGEKVPRVAQIIGDTKVKVEKETVTVSGSDSYAVGQTIANIRTATRIKYKDPRVFQDGVYEI